MSHSLSDRSIARTSSKPIPVTVKLERKHNFWGEPFRWSFAPGAVKQCLERAVRRRNSPVLLSIRDAVSHAGRVHAIHFDHFQEGDFQLVFRTRVTLAGRRPVFLSTILSKDPGKASRIGREEHGILQELSRRAPKYVVRTYHGTNVQMKWRSGIRPHYLYCGQWLRDYHELGVNRKMNFYINEQPFHHFDRPQTIRMKKEIVEICMALYDEESRTAIEPPLIGAGDFVVTRPKRGKPLRMKLIASRRLVQGLTREKALAMYRDYRGDWGGKIFKFS